MFLQNLEYSIPYQILVGIIILFVILEYRYSSKENVVLLTRNLTFLAFLIFFGFRGFIGWDWSTYFPLFNNMPSLLNPKFPLFLKNSAIESGFLIYMATIKIVVKDYFIFIFINNLIDAIVIHFFLKKYSEYYSLGFLIFIIMGGFYYETDLLRNAKSIMLFLVSIKYLKERKIIVYFLLNIVGMLFHKSSIIFLPLYFIANIFISQKAFIVIFIIGNIIFLTELEYIKPILLKVSELVGGKYLITVEMYLMNKNMNTSYGITVGYIERLITSALILIYYKKLIKLSSFNIIFINLFLLYFISYFFLSEIMVIPVRIGLLFVGSYWILIPALVKCIEVENNKKIFLIYLILYSIVKITGMTNSKLFEYDNTLYENRNYKSRIVDFKNFKE